MAAGRAPPVGAADTPPRRLSRGEAAALLASCYGLAHLVSPVPRVLVALLPVALLVALAVRRVLGMDELQRRIETVALAVAAVAAWLGLGTCWWLGHACVPLPSPQLGFAGMPLLYLLARRWARRRYT